MYPDVEVPITHVTNGAHIPTFVSEPLRRLFDRYLPDGWSTRAPSASGIASCVASSSTTSARSSDRSTRTPAAFSV
jgi:glucan phosphorylase